MHHSVPRMQVRLLTDIHALPLRKKKLHFRARELSSAHKCAPISMDRLRSRVFPFCCLRCLFFALFFFFLQCAYLKYVGRVRKHWRSCLMEPVGFIQTHTETQRHTAEAYTRSRTRRPQNCEAREGRGHTKAEQPHNVALGILRRLIPHTLYKQWPGGQT